MEIKKFELDKTEQRRDPFVIAHLNGKTSPPNFISIWDGEIGLCVALTDEEANKIKKLGIL
jgi:hypothetical protein